MTNTVPTGYTVTYAEDSTTTGCWADLRDAGGRVIETGNGPTQDAARANLLERATCRASHPLDGMACERLGVHERHAYTPFAGPKGMRVYWTDADQAALATAAPATATAPGLNAMITALTATGYSVSFTVSPEGFVASVSGAPAAPFEYEHDAIASTPAAALAAALPEGFAICACMHASGSHWEVAEPDGPRSGCAILGCPCRLYGELSAAPASGRSAPAVITVEERGDLRAELGDLGDRMNAVEKSWRAERELALLVVELLAGQDNDLGRRLRARGIAGLPAAPETASGAEAAASA